jgi:hypothetical protein
MKIIKWDSVDIVGIDKLNLQFVLTEIDNHGRVIRELGVGTDGKVIYRSGDGTEFRHRGLFDSQTIDLRGINAIDTVSDRDFEDLWLSTPDAS